MAIALTPIVAISVSASTPAFSGGTGTKDDPFLISTADDLVALKDAVLNDDGELDDKITNVSDALADAINTLEIADASNKDALLTKINEVYSTLDSAIKAVQKNLDDKTEMLEKSIASNKLVLDEKYNELKTFTIVVCVVSGVALLGSSAFVIWFFISRRKR